jgi:hypothetical protein
VVRDGSCDSAITASDIKDTIAVCHLGSKEPVIIGQAMFGVLSTAQCHGTLIDHKLQLVLDIVETPKGLIGRPDAGLEDSQPHDEATPETGWDQAIQP